MIATANGAAASLGLGVPQGVRTHSQTPNPAGSTAGSTTVSPSQNLPVRAHTRMIMGLPISVHCRGEIDRAAEDRALQGVWDDLAEADRIFSPYRDDSDISRMNRGDIAQAAADRAVGEVLALAETARRRTQGVFDVRYGGRLDPSGIVKGWAVARAAARHLGPLAGVDWYLNAGGDIALATCPGRQPWRIGVEVPRDTRSVMAVVELSGGAIATSGVARRGAHICDPRTGAPAAGIAQATVVGPDLVWADVFATALVAGGSAAPSWPLPPGYECLLVTDTGAVAGSPGMPRLIGVPQSDGPDPRIGVPG